MYPIIQQPSDRQLTLGSGVRTQHAGVASAGGIESAYAVGFDGVNDYIDCGNNAALSPSILSCSVWVKVANSATYQVILSKAGSTGLSKDWMLDIGGFTSKRPTFYVFSGNTGYSATSPNDLNDGVWHNIIGVWDGNAVHIAVNGIVVNTVNYVITKTTTSQALYVGQRLNGSWLNGIIDDLRIYNRALTAAEISSIYANISSPPTDGLVAYFPLDEGTGTTTTDEIAGLIGTLTSGPTWSTDVPTALQ